MGTFLRRLGLTGEALMIALRTVVATVASLLLARALRLPEFYWAPISTIVIVLSTIPPLTLAWQRFAGTAMGAALGAVLATYAPNNWMIYGVGIFLCGVLSAIARFAGSYRFSAITLSIVLLIAHTRPPWVVALHRFVEVSLGIAVALVITVVWPVPAKAS